MAIDIAQNGRRTFVKSNEECINKWFAIMYANLNDRI